MKKSVSEDRLFAAMRSVILSVEEDCICAHTMTIWGTRNILRFQTWDGLAYFLRGLPASASVMASSSVDFPNEYTGNPDVLAMVSKLQENRSLAG